MREDNTLKGVATTGSGRTEETAAMNLHRVEPPGSSPQVDTCGS